MTEEDWYKDQDSKLFIIIIVMSIFFMAIGYCLNDMIDCMRKASTEGQETSLYLKDRGGQAEIITFVAPDNYLYPIAITSPQKAQMRAIVTAYTSLPELTDSTPFITASGERVRKGIIACPVELPFGTVIEIEEDIYVCEDRMNQAKHPKRFDIWFETLEEAINFGIQSKTIKIY